MIEKLSELKGELDNSTVTVGDLYTHLLAVDGTGQKLVKVRTALVVLLS